MRLSELIDALAGRVPPVPEPQVAAPVALPEEDDPVEREARSLGYAEGQSFIIEYLDSAGRASTRRITVFEIVEGKAGMPCLMARCHERNAVRQFRVDRIRSCADFNGEVHEDVSAFLYDNLGMSPAIASEARARLESDNWNVVLPAIRSDSVLLAAIAKSDGLLRTVEIDAATQYLAWSVERSGIMLSDADIERIANHVRRLRPTRDAISRSLDALATRDRKQVIDLLRACVSVMNADGNQHPAEIAMINAISLDLVGVAIL